MTTEEELEKYKKAFGQIVKQADSCRVHRCNKMRELLADLTKELDFKEK